MHRTFRLSRAYGLSSHKHKNLSAWKFADQISVLDVY